MAYEAYYKYYEDRGFNFDRGLLTSYCLSLRTKPFVILSGISGTGKTKIAQFFSAPALDASQEKPAVASKPAPTAPTGKWIIMTVTDALMAGGDGRAPDRLADGVRHHPHPPRQCGGHDPGRVRHPGSAQGA